jgi:hypothetical protein
MARLLAIVQKAKTDHTARDPKNLPRLATRRPISTLYEPGEPDSCPICLDSDETCDHVMRCRERRRTDLHSSQIDDLRHHLVSTKTPRLLTTAIVQELTGWDRNPKPQIPHPNTRAHPSKHSSSKGAHGPKRYRLGPHVLRPNLPRLPNCA